MANEAIIVVRLSGGLGNQMHQYAYGCYLSQKHHATLFVDCSFYNLDANRLKITNRKFELGNLMLQAGEFRFLLSNYSMLRIVSKFSFLKKLIQCFFKITVVDSRPKDRNWPQRQKLYYSLGVFGTVHEYLQVAAELRKQFYPKPEIEHRLQTITDHAGASRVALHVRRSDYLNKESVHEVLPISYYHRAIELIKTKVKDPVFYLFGDDKKWITENFDLSNSQFRLPDFTGELSHLADFFAIQHCEHCILSNSTFAWWAAFLNPNQNSVVVAPGVWLKGTALSIEETYLTNWHVI